MSKVLAAKRIKRSDHIICNQMAIHCVKSTVTLPPVIPTLTSDILCRVETGAI